MQCSGFRQKTYGFVLFHLSFADSFQKQIDGGFELVDYREIVSNLYITLHYIREYFLK